MILKVQDLKKSFIQGERKISVLKGLNLEVEKGESVAILGQSGSGKSTLLSLLAGLDRPTSGSVQVSGQDLGKLSEEELTRFRGKNIGLVFQQFHLMKHLTAIENVKLPFEILDIEGGQKKAENLLERLGLGHRMDHLTHQLSGGECQRVAIARAMMTEPELLLADEPSGNLDRETGEQVINQLFELAKQNQLSLVVVTHSEQLALRCGRQLKLRDGILQKHEGQMSL